MYKQSWLPCAIASLRAAATKFEQAHQSHSFRSNSEINDKLTKCGPTSRVEDCPPRGFLAEAIDLRKGRAILYLVARLASVSDALLQSTVRESGKHPVKTAGVLIA